jgi:hypothetical protein
MDQRTITPAASRKVTPTGDARWRVSWKDGVARNIRRMPFDEVERGWHAIYKTKTTKQTTAEQARPVLPDEIDRNLSREPERDVPWACANRQHQDLALMTAEPCRCNPEQVRCCAEQLAVVTHSEAMLQHDYQVACMQAAAGYLLKDSPAWLRPYGEGSGTFNCLPPWKRIAVSNQGYWVREEEKCSGRTTWKWKTIAAGGRGRWVKLGHGRFGWSAPHGVILAHEKWRELRFRTACVDRLAEQRIEAAFVTMLCVADVLDVEFSRQYQRATTPFCHAPTLSARAYQPAASILTAYYDHELLHIVDDDILDARIVTEVFESCLQPRHNKQRSNVVDDYFIVTRMLDKSEDLRVSTYKIAERHGLEASTVRKRFNRKLEEIESQLNKYCHGYNALAYYPQTVSRRWYNIDCDAERPTWPPPLKHPQSYPPKSKLDREIMKVMSWGLKTLLLPIVPPPIFPRGAALGLPFDDRFERRSVSWLNKGTVHNGRADIKAAKKNAEKAAVKDTHDLMGTWVAPAAMTPNNIPLFE